MVILVEILLLLLIIVFALRRLFTILILVVLDRLLLVLLRSALLDFLQEVRVQVLTRDLAICLLVPIGLLRCNESFILSASHSSHRSAASLHKLRLSESAIAHAIVPKRLV